MAAALSMRLKRREIRRAGGETQSQWVNSVNAGFKVAEPSTKMNPCILLFSLGSGSPERSTACDTAEIIPLSLPLQTERIMSYVFC